MTAENGEFLRSARATPAAGAATGNPTAVAVGAGITAEAMGNGGCNPAIVSVYYRQEK
jgi:hypothetical protein